jgi:hypothetical protein
MTLAVLFAPLLKSIYQKSIGAYQSSSATRSALCIW